MEPIDINKVGQKLAAMDLAFELDGLEVHVNWFRAYESTAVPLDRWHYHSDMELHFMLEGSANFAFEKDLLTLRKGECVLIPAKYPHRLWGDTEHFSVRYVLALSLDYAGDDEEYSALISTLKASEYTTLAVSPEMETLLQNCLQEANQQYIGHKAKLKSYLICLMAEVARAISVSPSIVYSAKEKETLNRTRYRRALLYMEQHIEERITTEQVAGSLGLSTKQLNRAFLEESDQTINQAMMKMRLKHAKMLLKNTEHSISQISQMMGFSCEQSFTRFFKKGEGQTPSGYRNAILPIDYAMQTSPAQYHSEE